MFFIVSVIAALFSDISLSARFSTESALAEMFCTLTSRFWIWLGSAVSVAGSPLSGLASAAPPVIATAEAPVRPCISSRTIVSERTGMRLSTSISAATRPGSLARKSTDFTSPTRRPLNSTTPPRARPETEPWNSTR